MGRKFILEEKKKDSYYSCMATITKTETVKGVW